MRAFLSHASIDKPYVEQVVARLGLGQVEYDKDTFDKSLFNVQAILAALERTDLFVLFVSQNSLASTFVSLESKLAFERLGSGELRRILVICIDEASFATIPDFLRTTNIVTVQASPGAAARRIQSLLIDLDVLRNSSRSVFVGREESLRDLKRSLTKAPEECPTAVAISAQPGSGRRTIARKALQEALPSFSSTVEITLAPNTGVDDFFISLVRSRGRRSTSDAIEEIREFTQLAYPAKLEAILKEIDGILTENETLVLLDGGGLNREGGAHQEFIDDFLAAYQNPGRPICFVIRSYLPPKRVRQAQTNVEYFTLEPFKSEDSEALVGAHLKLIPAPYNSSQLRQLGRLSGGLPINAAVIASSIKELGSDTSLFLADTTEYVAWRANRSQDYISQFDFDSTSRRVVALLLVFRYLPTELLISICRSDAEKVAAAVRYLQERHCIVYWSGAYSVSPALNDAFERAEVFRLTRQQERDAAATILEVVETYRHSNDFDVSLIEPAIMASLRAGAKAAVDQDLRDIVLPSHLITLARDTYNHGSYSKCIEYCEEALSLRHRMSQDAAIETLRLLGMSAARLGRAEQLETALGQLRRIQSRSAKKQTLFLGGFSARLAGDWSRAERLYLHCFDLDQRNFSVCRELGHVYLALDRFGEAESYARRAVDIAPTNPFVIDILVGVLIGASSSAGEIRENREINHLLGELKKYGSGTGQSFYSRRMAERSFRIGDLAEAKRWIEVAVKETPKLPFLYYLQAKIYVRDRNYEGARRAIRQMRSLIDNPTADEAKSWLIFAQRAEVDLHIATREYRVAFNLLESLSNILPLNLLQKHRKELATTISFDEKFRDRELIEWAKGYRDTLTFG